MVDEAGRVEARAKGHSKAQLITGVSEEYYAPALARVFCWYDASNRLRCLTDLTPMTIDTNPLNWTYLGGMILSITPYTLEHFYLIVKFFFAHFFP